MLWECRGRASQLNLGKEVHWEVQGEIFRGCIIRVESLKTSMDPRDKVEESI